MQLRDRVFADTKTSPSLLEDVEDIVALVPGFFGFERLGGFAYFADHIAASLRASIELKTGRRTQVLPLNTLPTASMVARQHSLMTQLVRWHDFYRPKRIHLVGHSSGGVDAYFLCGKTTLAGTSWSKAEWTVRSRLQSVVTMGSPFWGTALSDSDIARFFAGNRYFAPSVGELLGLGTGLLCLLKENHSLVERLLSISTGIPAASGFLRQLIRHRELIEDLVPASMRARYERFEQDIKPNLACFASYVDPPEEHSASSLFCRLYHYTATGSDLPEDRSTLAANKKLLETASFIGNRRLRTRFSLDASSSDGVVNTLRQLPPGVAASQVGGVVLADHADLLGYFDHVDPLTDQIRQASIFRSGAEFRDDQFFELIHRISRQLMI